MQSHLLFEYSLASLGRLAALLLLCVLFYIDEMGCFHEGLLRLPLDEVPFLLIYAWCTINASACALSNNPLDKQHVATVGASYAVAKLRYYLNVRPRSKDYLHIRTGW